MNRRILVFFAALALLSGTLCARAAEVMVFAAASLTDSLKKIAPPYEKLSGDKLLFNFAASSLLERQIEAGAPADVFFSADEAKMDALEKKGLIITETRRRVLSNTLVIVVAADSLLKLNSPADLATPGVKHIALADPKAVPAGIYAREFLEKKNLWLAVKNKVVPTENVRAALAAVASGNVEAGVVYKTDAAISNRVRIACEVGSEEGPAISYPVAVIKDSKNPGAARKFAEYLRSSEGKKIFENYGFITVK
jgi:molybdate transport system substrate-binding protein